MADRTPRPSTTRRRLLGAAGGALASVPAVAWARGQRNDRQARDGREEPVESPTATPTPEPPEIRWPLFQYDQRNTGDGSALPAPSGTVGPRWANDAGTTYDTTPVVTEERVVVADPEENIVRAVEPDGGAIRWRREIPNAAARMTAQGSTLYVPTDGNATQLEALDLGSGSRRWSLSLGRSAVGAVADGRDLFVADYDGVFRVDADEQSVVWENTNPTIQDTTLAVTDDSVYAAGTFYGRVVRVDRESGGSNWVTELDSTAQGSPTVTNEGILVPSETALVLLDDFTGNETWRYEAPVGSSVAVSGGVVYGTTTGGDVFALDLADGAEQWRVGATSGSIAPLLVGGDLLVTGTDGTVAALDTADGSVNWSTDVGAEVAANPAVVDRELLLADRDGRVAALATGASGGYDTPTPTPTATETPTATQSGGATPTATQPGTDPGTPTATDTPFDDPEVATPTPTAPPATDTPDEGGGLDLPLVGGGVAAVAALIGGALWWRNQQDDHHDPLG